ncbi:MAG: methyltransferase domain-containing protein [Verrucomicrobia bacterium]|nr:methyltransferase domain-containing protein [Verrucomicrobiota bacterium]
MTTSPSSNPASHWLIRISKHFEHLADDIIADLGATLTKRLGEEYFLLQCPEPTDISNTDAARYIRWNLPVDHAWPCNPEKMDGFIEKAAQTLLKKFAHRDLQGVYVGRMDPSSPRSYYKSLATNLRGRTLPLFAAQVKGLKDVEEQDPKRSSLFCLVGKEGLYCGIQSPLKANGFYPGGTKFISQKAPHTVSRAGAKIAEALHFLKLHRPLPGKGNHWLELGASPGGMTSELLERGYQVTAVDRAPLDRRLDRRERLHFIKADVAKYHPAGRVSFDAILCDMNGDVQTALGQVIRLSKHLRPEGLALYTLKSPGAKSFRETNDLFHLAIANAGAAGMKLIASTHLTYNRHEFTLFFELKTKVV